MWPFTIGWDDIDWTATGTLLAAFAAMAAAIVALVTGVLDRRNANRNAEDDRKVAREQLAEMQREREDRSRGHLSLRWVVIDHGPGDPKWNFGPRYSFRFTVTNTGGPVSDLHICLSGPVGRLLEGQDLMEEHTWFHIDFIATGETIEPFVNWQEWRVSPYASRDQLPMSAKLEYTDGTSDQEIERSIESDGY